MKRPAILFLDPKGTTLEVIRSASERDYAPVALLSDPIFLESSAELYRSALPLIERRVHVKSWLELSTLDQITKDLSRDFDIKGVHFTLDACAAAGNHLRSALGLPCTEHEAIRSILNKYEMRLTLIKRGLSSIQAVNQREADCWTQWKPGKHYYFKPVQGSFSAYVALCRNLDDLDAAKVALSEGSDSDPKALADYIRAGGEYYLEEAFPGELMSVEALVYEGEFLPLGLTSRILFSKNHVVEMGSVFPYDRPDKETIIEKVRKVTEALRFENGAIHVELIVDETGAIEIIDFNPRFVGADVMQSINHAYGIRIQDSLVDLAIGVRPHIRPLTHQYSCIQYVLCPPVSRFETIHLPNSPEVHFKTSFIPAGTALKSNERQLDYAGCYLTVMPTFKEALEKSHELRSEVRINGDRHGLF